MKTIHKSVGAVDLKALRFPLHEGENRLGKSRTQSRHTHEQSCSTPWRVCERVVSLHVPCLVNWANSCLPTNDLRFRLTSSVQERRMDVPVRTQSKHECKGNCSTHLGFLKSFFYLDCTCMVHGKDSFIPLQVLVVPIYSCWEYDKMMLQMQPSKYR